MAEVEKRYWDRVGMYVTRKFAEEWIQKMGESRPTGGKHLDEDIEEFVVAGSATPVELRDEIKTIFEQPFEQVELPADTGLFYLRIKWKGVELHSLRKERVKALHLMRQRICSKKHLMKV